MAQFGPPLRARGGVDVLRECLLEPLDFSRLQVERHYGVAGRSIGKRVVVTRGDVHHAPFRVERRRRPARLLPTARIAACPRCWSRFSPAHPPYMSSTQPCRHSRVAPSRFPERCSNHFLERLRVIPPRTPGVLKRLRREQQAYPSAASLRAAPPGASRAGGRSSRPARKTSRFDRRRAIARSSNRSARRGCRTARARWLGMSSDRHPVSASTAWTAPAGAADKQSSFQDGGSGERRHIVRESECPLQLQVRHLADAKAGLFGSLVAGVVARWAPAVPTGVPGAAQRSSLCARGAPAGSFATTFAVPRKFATASRSSRRMG